MPSSDSARCKVLRSRCVGIAQRSVVRAVRTVRSHASGALQREQMHALRMKKTSFGSDQMNDTDR